MHKELVIKNLLIMLSSLLVFFLLSFAVVETVNRRNAETEIVYLSVILGNEIKEETNNEEELRAAVNKFTEEQQWFKVVIATTLGDIVYDSTEDAWPDGVHRKLESYELNKLSASGGSGTVYSKGSRVYYISQLTDDMVYRTSIAVEDGVNFILLSMFVLVGLMIIVLVMSIWLIGKTSKRVTGAFDSIQDNLRLISEGKYQKIDEKHRYEEVAKAYKEVNAVNSTIFQYITQISAERDKINYIINNINEGIVIIGESGTVYSINDFALNLFGVDDKNSICSYEDVIKDDKFRKLIAKEMADHSEISFDYTDKNADKIFLVTLNYFNRGGTEENLISIVLYDVTALRKEERIKADFIANASHELKSPITSISGFSELILSGLVKSPADVKKYVGNIHDESLKMKSTVESLLYLSKLDYSDELKDESLVNVADICAECVEKYKGSAKHKSVKCKLIANETLVKGNASLLFHLVANLLDNAIKYNRKGGNVTIETGTSEDGRKFLKVSDTGCGIEPQNISKLFDRFYRVDESRNRDEGGSGLGLTIVQRICDLHHATIQIKSEFGTGTQFTVLFEKEGNND